jgi:ribosome maturation factor RimP
MSTLSWTEETIVGTQHFQIIKGHKVKVVTSESATGTWQSRAEIALGRTGHVIFENDQMTYSSAEEASEAVLALASANLFRSRIETSHAG